MTCQGPLTDIISDLQDSAQVTTVVPTFVVYGGRGLVQRGGPEKSQFESAFRAELEHLVETDSGQ